MKHISLYLLLLLVLCTSCVDRHYYMNTEVHADGTCSRELWFKADSATLTGTPSDRVKDVHQLFADDQWVKTIAPLNEPAICSYPMSQALYDSLQAQILATDTTRYRLGDTLRIYARRDFASVEKMAEAMPFTLAGQSLRTTATLESHFRWFYTDYTYTETFPSLASLFQIPITKYMDEQMASFWLTGTPNPFRHKSGMEQADYFEKMSADFWKWVFANRANDLVDLFIDNYDSIVNAPISKADLLAHKQEFIDHIAQLNINIQDEDMKRLSLEIYHQDIPALDAGLFGRTVLIHAQDDRIGIIGIFHDDNAKAGINAGTLFILVGLLFGGGIIGIRIIQAGNHAFDSTVDQGVRIFLQIVVVINPALDGIDLLVLLKKGIFFLADDDLVAFFDFPVFHRQGSDPGGDQRDKHGQDNRIQCKQDGFSHSITSYLG